MAMTIEEIKKKKIELETLIADEIKAFEDATGARVGYLDISRERDEKQTHNCPCTVMDEPYKTMPVKSVDFDLRFDD